MTQPDPIVVLQDLIKTRGPHCFRAFVQGQGYVNDGTIAATRADYDRQYHQAAQSELNSMTFAVGYAELGYTQPTYAVLLANWNTLPIGADCVLEALGFAIEWADEWAVCEDCNRAFRTEPYGYGWRPSGQIFESSDDRAVLVLCKDCLQDGPGQPGRK